MTAAPAARSVFLVGNFLSAAGRNRAVCEDLAERLAGAGWHVVSASSREGRVSRLVDMISMTIRARARYRVAVLDVFSGPALVWAEATALVLRRLGKPYVLVLRGGGLPQHAARWPGRVGGLLAGAAAVIAPSTYLLDRLRPVAPWIRLLPNPADLAAFPFQARGALRPRLVWVRAFQHLYRPEKAVEVLAALGDHPEATLTMVGPDKGDGSLEATRAEAQRLGLLARVTFAGKVSRAEVSRLLADGDIFLNTTSVDNTPMSVIQAMASGLPVVSTNVGGIPYLLEDGKDALLVPPDDPDAMAASVRRLLDDPTLGERLTARALDKVKTFDWPVVLERWDRLLSHVAETGRAPEVV